MSASIVQNRWDNAGFSLAKKSRQCLGERANYISNTMLQKTDNSICFQVWVRLKSGTGVPPVNHAQDARVTFKPIRHLFS